MQIDPTSLKPREAYRLFISIVTPLSDCLGLYRG